MLINIATHSTGSIQHCTLKSHCWISSGGTGGIGPRCGNIPGIFLRLIRHDKGTGIRGDLERAQCSYRTLLEIKACFKCFKVSDDDVPTWITAVRRFRGGGWSAMHRGGSVMPVITMETDTIPKMMSWTDYWVHDGTLENDVQDRASDRLEPAASQSDRTPTPGVWHQIPKIHIKVHLPLT